VGSWIFNSGYASYSNPYYVQSSVNSTTVYDYSQPLDVPPVDEDGNVPEDAVSDPAMEKFDQARAAFKQQNYDQALSLVDEALKDMPNDAVLHEFRGLILFAVGRYSEAAAAIYAVLSVGAG